MKKVIDYKNKPAIIPFWQSITVFLFLSHFDTPGWVWGIVGTLMVIWWIGSLVAVKQQTEIDIFHVSDDPLFIDTPGKKSKFQQKLEDAMKAADVARENRNSTE